MIVRRSFGRDPEVRDVQLFTIYNLAESLVLKISFRNRLDPESFEGPTLS